MDPQTSLLFYFKPNGDQSDGEVSSEGQNVNFTTFLFQTKWRPMYFSILGSLKFVTPRFSTKTNVHKRRPKEKNFEKTFIFFRTKNTTKMQTIAEYIWIQC